MKRCLLLLIVVLQLSCVPKGEEITGKNPGILSVPDDEFNRIKENLLKYKEQQQNKFPDMEPYYFDSRHETKETQDSTIIIP